MKNLTNILVACSLAGFPLCAGAAVNASPFTETVANVNDNITVTGKVQAQDGTPLPGVTVALKGTTDGTISDVDGVFSLQASQDGVLVFSFAGYIDKEVVLSGKSDLGIIVLDQDINDDLVNVAFGTVQGEDLLGGVSSVNVAELLKKDYHIDALADINAIVGGYNGSTWGKSPLVLIDGSPRDLSYVRAVEVQSVTVLKAASAVVLYGSRGANGAILITTKHGKEQSLRVDVTANTGFNVAKSYPEYLGAAEYMTLYNEAYRNDGHNNDYYDAATIYNTAAGVNPSRYPDMDFYSSDFLKKAFNVTDGNVEISGGTDKARYYADFGMEYQGGMIKYGDHKNDKIVNFHVRGNVDMSITKWLTGKTNAAINVGNSYDGRGDFWGAAASLRPNWYSPFVPIDKLDQDNESLMATVKESNNIIDGNLLGGNNANQTTVYGDMLKAGYIKGRTRSFLFDESLTANLRGITEGLTFTAGFSIDYYNDYNEAFKVDYATYEPVWSNMNGTDMIVDLKQYGVDKNSTNEYIGQSFDYQTIMANARFDYQRSFSAHNLKATLVGWGWQNQQSKDDGHESSDAHKLSNLNAGLQVDYNYDKKYYVELASALVHSAKLAEGHRNAFSPSVALGWRLSNEDFLSGVDFISNLKLNAAYTVVNHDIDLDWYMYQGAFKIQGVYYQWQDATQGGWSVSSTRGGNENLGFIQNKEWRVGLEGGLLDDMICFEFNYFNTLTDGLTTNGSATMYPSYFTGIGSFLPYENYNQDLRKGFDFKVNFNKEFGQVKSSLGFCGMVYNTEAKKRDEYYADLYQYREGKSLNTAWGLECEGFFQNQEEINAHATQTFGEVRPGDLKYKDQNGDGLIDGKDEISLGSYAPNLYYGINLTINWKNFTFFALGSGQSGAIGFKNNGYYWIRGGSKYSEVVRDRWTEQTAQTASYPRLTTTNNDNNLRNSTFWKYSTNQFNLSVVQLTYNMPQEWFSGNIIKGVSVYFNARNLARFSKEREYMDLSIGGLPQCRFYNLGVKVNL